MKSEPATLSATHGRGIDVIQNVVGSDDHGRNVEYAALRGIWWSSAAPPTVSLVDSNDAGVRRRA